MVTRTKRANNIKRLGKFNYCKLGNRGWSVSENEDQNKYRQEYGYICCRIIISTLNGFIINRVIP